MTKFSIPVIEYQSARPGLAMKPSHQLFVVNDRQLIVSMVRSTLTANSGKASRKYMAAIVKPTLQFLLDWNRAPNLSVSADFLNVLRDFSSTTRIGELAQGISYAYWKYERGYSWISDFAPWAAGLVPPYTGTKSPDFVMINLTTNDVAIMESKGTGSDCHKAPMNKAIFQCKSALAEPIPVIRGFGSVLTLDSGNPFGIGTLHIRDPESSAEITDELRYQLFRRSYASWFDLVGDDELADWCHQEVNSVRVNPIDRQRIEQRPQNSSSDLAKITASALGFDPQRTSFEIDTVVTHALMDFNSFRQTDWHVHSQRMQNLDANNQKSVHFPDGTSIIERSA